MPPNERTRRIALPSATLWSTRTGSGPPLVMLHGGPGMADYLGPVAAQVEDLATVYRYDQRGGGRSTGGPPFDVATAVADLDAVRAAWGVAQWTLFGHSWGASLALAYAVTYPERTVGVVYVSGTGVDPAWHDVYHAERLARLEPDQQRRWHELRALRQHAGDDEREVIEREYAELCAVTDLADAARVPQLIAWLRSGGFPVNQEVNRALGEDARRVIESPEFAARLGELRVPALVIHGERDPRPARFAAQVAALIPGAELMIMPNVGHYPRFEDPDGFARIFRAFLTKLYAQAKPRVQRW